MLRVLATAIVIVACGSPPPPAAPVPPPPDPEPSESSRRPAGYVDARVMQVLPTEGGGLVLLLDESTQRIVPIFIGGTEAASIDFRMRRTKPQRPLTHDLLDKIVRRLGGKLVKVQVDELRDSTFIGSVFVRTNGRIIKIDARPSDALALAIGNKLPIYVAKKVVEEAGVPKDEIIRQLTPPAGSSA